MSLNSKQTLAHLLTLFSPASPPPPPSQSTSSAPPLPPPNPFPAFTLPPDLLALLDSHIRHFANLPTTSTSPNSPSPAETERGIWRNGLLDIWTRAVEPQPGHERDLSSIGRVSAFLVLLDRLSAEQGDDEDSAIISRKDVGGVWWKAVLRRALLGTPKEAGGAATGSAEDDKGKDGGRGRKATRKGKEPEIAAQSASQHQQLPLYVSRAALAAAQRTVVWGMGASSSLETTGDFAAVILKEYEERALARLRGHDEGYGVKNLEEAVGRWGDRVPKVFFTRLTPFLHPSSPSLLPSLSLLLSFLTSHSTKSFHALSTPLLSSILVVALSSPCAAVVGLAAKCLAIFVVTLPVIIGEQNVAGIMAVFGRIVSWEEGAEAEERDLGTDELHNTLQEYDDVTPSPMLLFTVLYGIYPCNFTSFIRDAVAWLRELPWKSPVEGDGGLAGLISGVVRERSEPFVRLHTLHPSLFVPNSSSTSHLKMELGRTKPWTALEAADVMALCDRNVITVGAADAAGRNWRGVATTSPMSVEQAALSSPTGGESREVAIEDGQIGEDARDSIKRSLLFEPSSLQLQTDLPSPLDSLAPTPKPTSPVPSPAPSRPGSRSASVVPSPHHRNLSLARSSASHTTTNTSNSLSPSRHSNTPHMPATTHFANFQALQQGGAGLTSPPMSPLVRPRSQSRLRLVGDSSEERPLSGGWGTWSGVLDSAVAAIPQGVNLSRRSSGAASSLHGHAGLLSPDLVPFQPLPSSLRSASVTGQASAGSGGAAAVQAQLIKLETELLLLQGEVNFQGYLKQLHLQHMGTLHREKVLESGAEAERQSSFRTIRTLRAQLRSTQSSLDQLRSEQSSTKANWTAHIADLREKLGGLREQRVKWEHEQRVLRAEVEDWRERFEKKEKEGEVEGREYFDLRNQVAVDSVKLAKIGEYEHRIQALTKTLAICDADIIKFVDQRREMNALVGEWKRSEMLRESVEEEGRKLKEDLRSMETQLVSLRRSASTPSAPSPTNDLSVAGKDELARMRDELERLRRRNLELEERLLDKLDDE